MITKPATATVDFSDLPGAELVRAGLDDLGSGRESVSSLLVSIGSPRLRACGIDVPVTEARALDADRRLYRLLADEHGNEAHSRYNALLRELVSFERAMEQRLSRESRQGKMAA